MAAKSISLARLREMVFYDPGTGIFTRLVSSGGVPVGAPCGSVRADGYHEIILDRARFYAHRLAWFYCYEIWPTLDIDHVDGSPSNNRLANLREVSRSVNMQNQKHVRGNKRSCQLLGVTYAKDKQKYKAQINSRHIGYFESPELAHAAYIEAKRRIHAGCTI